MCFFNDAVVENAMRESQLLKACFSHLSDLGSDPCQASIRAMHVIGLVERLRYYEGLEHASFPSHPSSQFDDCNTMS
jgi:ketol-acid reductoisomerase